MFFWEEALLIFYYNDNFTVIFLSILPESLSQWISLNISFWCLLTHRSAWEAIIGNNCPHIGHGTFRWTPVFWWSVVIVLLSLLLLMVIDKLHETLLLLPSFTNILSKFLNSPSSLCSVVNSFDTKGCEWEEHIIINILIIYIYDLFISSVIFSNLVIKLPQEICLQTQK